MQRKGILYVTEKKITRPEKERKILQDVLYCVDLKKPYIYAASANILSMKIS
jgi:hypothetical protein